VNLSASRVDHYFDQVTQSNPASEEVKAGAPVPDALKHFECGGKRSATPLRIAHLEIQSAVAASLCRRTPRDVVLHESFTDRQNSINRKRSAAERRKICSPWREPWNKIAKTNEPRQGRYTVDVLSSFAALRLSHRRPPYPRLTPCATDLLPLRGCS